MNLTFQLMTICTSHSDIGTHTNPYTLKLLKVQNVNFEAGLTICSVSHALGTVLSSISLVQKQLQFRIFEICHLIWNTFLNKCGHVIHHFFVFVGNFFFSIYFYQLEANYFPILQWFLSYIDMNQPWIYMYCPSRSPLPPPSLPAPSGSPQCTRPKHLSHASSLGW